MGAVAVGAMAGFAGSLLFFLILGISGIVDSPSDAIPLLILEFGGLVGAGYVAGRLAGRDQVVHGGYAGLLVFFVATVITLAATPGSASPLVLLFTAFLAVVLGSAGGTLAKATGNQS